MSHAADTNSHYWEFTVTETSQQAVCQNCQQFLVATYKPETVAERTIRLVEFMHTLDDHERVCWGYVVQPVQ